MADQIGKDAKRQSRAAKDGQFKDGQSGKKSGRPKGRLNMKTIVTQLAHERHGTFTTVELIFLALQKRALGGDLGATKLLGQFRERYEQDELPKTVSGIVFPPTLNMEEWEIVAAAQRERMIWLQREREKRPDTKEKESCIQMHEL